MFNKGFRGRMAQAESRTGSGQGLFASRKIMSQPGGSLRIDSRNVGDSRRGPYLTVVTVDIPIRQ